MYNDRDYINYEDPYPLRHDATFRNNGDYFGPGQQRYQEQRGFEEGYEGAFAQDFPSHGYNQDYLGHNVNRGADPFIMHNPIDGIDMRGRYGDLNHVDPYDAVGQNGRFSSSPYSHADNYEDMRGQIYQDLRYAYDTDDPYMDMDSEYFPNAQKGPYGQFNGLPNNGFGYDSDYPMYGSDRGQQDGYSVRNRGASNHVASSQAIYDQGMHEQTAYGQGMYEQAAYDPFAANRHATDGLSQYIDQDLMAPSDPYGNSYSDPHGNPYGDRNPYPQQYPDQYSDHAQINQYPDRFQYQDQHKIQYQEGAAPSEMPFASEFDMHQVANDALNQYQQGQGQSPYQDMSAPMRSEMDFPQGQSQAYSMSSTGAVGGQTDQVSMSDFGQQYGHQPMQGFSYQMQNAPYEMQNVQTPMQNMQTGMPQYQQSQQGQQGIPDMQPSNPYGQQPMMPNQQGTANFQNDPNMGFGMQGAQGMQPNPMMQDMQGSQGMQGMQGSRPDQMMQGAQFDPMMQNGQSNPMMQDAQPFNGQQPNGQMPGGPQPNTPMPMGQMSPGQPFDGQQPYMQQPDNQQFNGQPPVDGPQHPNANEGATKYLIFGILSIILGLIPPVGIVLAILTRRMVKKFHSNGGTDSKADAANIFALVGLIFSIAVLVLIVVFIVLLLTGSAFALNIAYAFNQSPIGSLITIPI